MLDKLKFSFVRGGLRKYIEKIKTSRMAKLKYSSNSDDNLDVFGQKSKTFSQTLLDFIDNKKTTDVDCYKRANIDRRLFSKIRSNEEYQPSKNTVFAFAIALKLNLQETQTLLASAGYSLSHSFNTDIILEYFIEKKKYDINLINIALAEYNEKAIGSF